MVDALAGPVGAFHGWRRAVVAPHSGVVTVEPGQAIEVGAVVGDVGNSGNSVGPHLHMQVMTSADPFDADVVAWRLAAFERWTGSEWSVVEDAPLPLRAPIRSPR